MMVKLVAFVLTWDNGSSFSWEAGLGPLQTFMCRTCLSSLARARSLSLNRLSASLSLSSSSCSRLCCLCRRASSPMVDPALDSRFPPSRLWACHTPPAAVGSCGCSSNSRMESCLITAACRKWSRISVHDVPREYSEINICKQFCVRWVVLYSYITQGTDASWITHFFHILLMKFIFFYINKPYNHNDNQCNYATVH